jgi:hypothetical protein
MIFQRYLVVFSYLIILFFFFSIQSFAQDSVLTRQKDDFTDIVSSDSIIDSCNTLKTEEVSVVGATFFSFILPGAGLFLTEEYLPATLYLFIGTGTYGAAIASVVSSNEVHLDDPFPLIFLVTGGLIHLAGIMHTVFATIEYNESITPLVSFNGKNIQFGLSIKI